MSVLGRREPGSSGTGRPLSLPPPHLSTLYALFCGSGGNPRRGAAPVTHRRPCSRSAGAIITYPSHLVPYTHTAPDRFRRHTHAHTPPLALFFTTTCHFNIFRERRRRRRGRFSLFLSRGRRPSPYADVNIFTFDRSVVVEPNTYRMIDGRSSQS